MNHCSRLWKGPLVSVAGAATTEETIAVGFCGDSKAYWAVEMGLGKEKEVELSRVVLRQPLKISNHC